MPSPTVVPPDAQLLCRRQDQHHCSVADHHLATGHQSPVNIRFLPGQREQLSTNGRAKSNSLTRFSDKVWVLPHQVPGAFDAHMKAEKEIGRTKPRGEHAGTWPSILIVRCGPRRSACHIFFRTIADHLWTRRASSHNFPGVVSGNFLSRYFFFGDWSARKRIL